MKSKIEELEELAHKIKDDDIRVFTLKIIAEAPLETWFAPASRRHHLEDERGDWGNAIHTMRVVNLCLIYAECMSLASIGKDILLSAAIIHDICRHGILAKSEVTLPEHPGLVRQLAYELNTKCKYQEEILSAVEKHMGKWSLPPVQFYDEDGSIDTIALLLHLADATVARWAEAANI